jgi:type I restriction enzyme S subunit
MSEAKTLGNNIRILSGFPFPSTDFTSERNGHPLVRIRDLQQQDPETYFTGDYDHSFLITKGDVLVGMDGDFNAIKWQGPPSLLNQRVCKITTKDPTLLDQDFLYHSLQPQLNRIHNGTAQTTVKHLSTKDLYSIDTELPPLPEQKKIAEILSGIDMAIEKSIVASIKIRTLSKAVLAKEASKHAKKGTEDLRDACELITKGATPTTYGHKLSTNRSLDSVSFLGGGNASPEGRFIYGSERYCSQEAAESLRRSDLKEGDSLVTIVGYVGNTCIIPKEILPANINQNVALIRADARRLHPKYLNLFLRTDGCPQLAQVATTQAQPSVSLKQVGDLKIYLPSMEEQLHAVKQADSFSRKEIQLERKIDSLRLLKTAVASDLLSGRKRVSV